MRPALGRAMAAGLLATIAFGFTTVAISSIAGGTSLDLVSMLGAALGGGALIGLAGHFVMGTLVHPTVYALIAYRWLPGPPVVRGALWGTGLWLALQAGLVPLMGGGPFGSGTGDLTMAATSLVEHLVYGAALGALAGGGEAPLRRARHEPRALEPFRRAG